LAYTIQLNSDYFIKEGIRQKCYAHPYDERLCIKIAKPNIENKRLFNEIKYWSRYSKKKIKARDYPFFSRYYGRLDTNLGTGHIFDLVRDETTGECSKTLDYYLLNAHGLFSDRVLEIAFEKLIHLMSRYKVIANDIKPENICCRILKNQAVELVLVDGVGHRDFIPLVDWSSFFARKKIQRRLIKLNLHDLKVHKGCLREAQGRYLRPELNNF
jgi:hypothetical protein